MWFMNKIFHNSGYAIVPKADISMLICLVGVLAYAHDSLYFLYIPVKSQIGITI